MPGWGWSMLLIITGISIWIFWIIPVRTRSWKAVISLWKRVRDRWLWFFLWLSSDWCWWLSSGGFSTNVPKSGTGWMWSACNGFYLFAGILLLPYRWMYLWFSRASTSCSGKDDWHWKYRKKEKRHWYLLPTAWTGTRKHWYTYWNLISCGLPRMNKWWLHWATSGFSWRNNAIFTSSILQETNVRIW